MRHLFTGFIAALMLTSLATQAEARRGGYSTHQQLIFVSPTEFEDETGPLALCHFVETHAVLFINVWRSMQSYALASDNCQTESYYEFTAADLSEAQADGMIPANLPIEPKMSLKSLAEGFWGFGAIALLLLFAAFKLLKVQQRKGKRMAMMTNATPGAKAILDAMCHAAKADGRIDPSEVSMIKGAAEEMTGTHFALEDVKHMADLAEQKMDQNAYKRLIKGRTKPEQLDMMRGVLMVVAADGVLDGNEKTFVGGLAQAMQMDGQTVNALLAEVVGGAASNDGGAPVPA